jgi:hypothetical protein
MIALICWRKFLIPGIVLLASSACVDDMIIVEKKLLPRNQRVDNGVFRYSIDFSPLGEVVASKRTASELKAVARFSPRITMYSQFKDGCGYDFLAMVSLVDGEQHLSFTKKDVRHYQPRSNGDAENSSAHETPELWILNDVEYSPGLQRLRIDFEPRGDCSEDKTASDEVSFEYIEKKQEVGWLKFLSWQ